MNEVVIIETIVRSNGRRYPVSGVLPEPERWRAINAAHRLVHQEDLSYRAAQQAMLSQGIRRSLGQVYKDVHAYACRVCSPEQFTGG